MACVVLPGALTNYLILVEFRKLNKAPKRENRELHKRTHTATTRIFYHTLHSWRTTVLISPSGELYEGSWELRRRGAASQGFT